jgi:DNA-directed RNA polymerase subunit H
MAMDISKHVLVPVHTKLSKKDGEELLEKLNVSLMQLPKILVTDSAIASLKPSMGDIIRIERKSQTRGTSVYYRVVINA